MKEMYDWLPHSDLISAIKCILSYVRTSTRRDSVCVHTLSSKLNRMGRSYAYDNEFKIISLQEIFDITLFEISNAFFVLDNHIFWQKIGCPMGAPGSPGSSMAVCIFYEKSFHDSLYDYQKVYRLFRYFDDLRALTVFKSTDLTTKAVCLQIMRALQSSCYHKNMSIVPEPTQNHSFKFLEGTISINDRRISSVFTSKNFMPLLTTGKLTFLACQDFFSFSGDKYSTTRKATISGRLAAVLGYSFPDDQIILGFGQLLTHLLVLKYEWKVILNVLHKKWVQSKEVIWKILIALTKDIKKEIALLSLPPSTLSSQLIRARPPPRILSFEEFTSLWEHGHSEL